MLKELVFTIDEINDMMDKLSKDASRDLKIMKKKFEDASIAANNFASILSDISSLMEDDDSSKKMVASLGFVSKAISGIVQELGDMSKAWKKGELDAFGAVASISGIIATIITAVSSIAGLDRDKQISPLQEEFLSPEQAGRLSPDYGQARVVYNNNSLATSFQFLDVSQLTPHTQRNIAEGFADELAEILKSRGDI